MITRSFLSAMKATINGISAPDIERMALAIRTVRESAGRLFILGVGGSAANASHAVNDFRKLCGVEAYAPTDNVAELTARINDDGWDNSLAEWLWVSLLGSGDAILVLSVGGGSIEPPVSMNLVKAIDAARNMHAKILAIVGRDGGYAKAHADVCVHIPVVEPEWTTPLAEAAQAVVWHALVSSPILAVQKAKWESMAPIANALAGRI